MSLHEPTNTLEVTVAGYPEPIRLKKEEKTWFLLDEKGDRISIWGLDFDTYCAMAGQCRILGQQKVEDGVVCVVFDRGAFHEAFVVLTPNSYKLEDMEKGTRITALRMHEKFMNLIQGKRNSPKESPFDNKMVIGVSH